MFILVYQQPVVEVIEACKPENDPVFDYTVDGKPCKNKCGTELELVKVHQNFLNLCVHYG